MAFLVWGRRFFWLFHRVQPNIAFSTVFWYVFGFLRGFLEGFLGFSKMFLGRGVSICVSMFSLWFVACFTVFHIFPLQSRLPNMVFPASQWAEHIDWNKWSCLWLVGPIDVFHGSFSKFCHFRQASKT